MGGCGLVRLMPPALQEIKRKPLGKRKIPKKNYSPVL
jgi:hypothetical protein